MKQKPWDRYEAALLLSYCLKIEAGDIPRKEAVDIVSNTLRKRAEVQGVEIDETFRNTNGISMQMSAIRNCYLGKDHGLAGSKLFHEMVDLYKSNHDALEQILQGESDKVNRSIWQEFLLWLKEAVPDKEKEIVTSLAAVSMLALKSNRTHKSKRSRGKTSRDGRIRLISFKNFCPYQIDLDQYKDARREFSTDEWIDIILGAVDYNANGYETEEQKLTMLTRLLPFVEKRLNLIELAPKGTGKSYLFGNVSRFGWLSSGGVMSRAKMFYDQTKRKEGLIAGNDFVTLDEVQTISFTDTDEMRAALKGYLEQGNFTVGDYKGVADAGVILCGNIRKEIMDADGYSNMFTELPVVFHESALIERFHGFIKGWNIPRMNDDLKVDGWALNSEYFCSIMHELRSDMTYRTIVDELIIVPEGADTRDTEAVKRML